MSNTVFGVTYYVPDHFSTIQEAVADSGTVDYDTIIVRPGTYFERIDFLGKNIIVISESGPAMTFIDGVSGGDVVTFENGETGDAVLEGFTICNGNNGVTTQVNFVTPGPIATPRILNNIIEDNANFGICDYYSDRSGARGSEAERTNDLMRIEGNTIRNNGAGIRFIPDWYGTHGSAIIENNLIIDNAGVGIEGGGFPSPIAGNIIMGNMGGGITLRGTIMIATLAGFHGNVVAFNEAPQFGGGVRLNCVYCPDFSNNTFYGNATQGNGGAVSLVDCHFCDIKNCVFWSNSAMGNGDALYVDNGTSAAIDYSLLEGGQAAAFVEPAGSLVWGEAMPMPADPSFVDAENGDLHITRFSSCVNRGTADVGALYDMDGDLLPAWGSIDIGADEFTGTPLLAADVHTLSAGTGGVVDLTLLARSSDAGRKYLILGTLSGISPGTSAPGGAVVIPVNMDIFTSSVLFPLLNTSVFSKFLGTLDAQGNGQASIQAPPLPPSAIGAMMHYAFVLNAPFNLASNPVQVEIQT